MKQRHRWLIGVLAVVALAALVLIAPGEDGALAQVNVIFVDADAEGANDGSTWGNAFTTLQPALETAGTGDQIWVAEGTYTPTTEHGGTGPRYRSFQMKNGVAIYGGFAGGETELGQRDWDLHETILSGDIGIEGDSSDNSYHVFYHPWELDLDGTAILDGFTITAGHADGADSYGGGMYNQGSSPVLANCIFAYNSASVRGGGMYNQGSSPVLANCIFAYNSVVSQGGGMANYESSPTLTNCSFEGNSAYEGGGMANYHDSSSTLTRCTFSGNEGVWGGGMKNYESSPALTNCTFEGNSAIYGGGGMWNDDGSTVTLTNSILWGDSPEEIANSNLFLSPLVTYSNVQGGHAGEGNIDADPLFVSPLSDFHLGPDSPCIDVGNNAALYLPEYDFEGDDRVMDGDGDGSAIVDMGVDEVVYAGPPVVEVEIDIRPGSEQNPINLDSGGVVPVAILTTDEFDASTVRPASVLFAGAQPRRWTMEDVDRDGDLDLLLNFRIQQLDLDQSSTEATLTGETFPYADGVSIEGTDTVRIIP